MKTSKNHDFKTKEVEHYGNLGEKLKKIREKKGYTLDQVSVSAQIKKSWLEQIEANDFDKLPPDVFVQGFLKKYSEFLGVNPKIITNWFKRERAIAKNIEKIEQPRPLKPIKEKKVFVTPKRIWLTVLFFGLFSITGFIYYQFSAFRNPPRLEIISPKENESTKESSVMIEGKTDPGADIFINEQSIPIAEDGTFKISFSLVSGPNSIKISAKNKVGKENVVEKTVIAQIPKLEEAGTEIVETKIEATLEVLNKSTFIEIESDGQKTNQIAAPKTTQQLVGKEKIIITTGNAANIKIKYKDVVYENFGKDGEAKKIVIDETGVKY